MDPLSKFIPALLAVGAVLLLVIGLLNLAGVLPSSISAKSLALFVMKIVICSLLGVVTILFFAPFFIK